MGSLIIRRMSGYSNLAAKALGKRMTMNARLALGATAIAAAVRPRRAPTPAAYGVYMERNAASGGASRVWAF